MLDVLSRKKNPIEEQLEKYLEATSKCKDSFLGGLTYFIQYSNGDEEYLKFVHSTKKYEGIADDIRDGIERRMYEESLISESRGDVLAFLETFDRIPKTLWKESWSLLMRLDFLFLIILANRITKNLLEIFRNYVMELQRPFELARNSAQCFFSKPRRVRDYTVAIDRHESQCDNVESDLKRYVFHHDGFSDLQKILFKELFKRIGDIADLAEDFQRRIILLSLKNLY